MTRVAVVIPCFNDGQLVVDAVASVREEEPVEVVVVDDGSDDEATLAWLVELRERGIRVVRRPNGGPAMARMTGVEATTAPYIFPLDADDLLEPGALTELADLLDEYRPAAFAWGDYLLFGDYEGRYRSPRAFLPWSLTYVNLYPVSSLIRRSALEQAGGWRGRRVDYEDWELWLSFVGLGLGGVGADRVVYRRRIHGARTLTGARRQHRALYRKLKRSQQGVFERRRELRRIERPPLWKPFVFPILFGSRAVVPFRLEAWLQRTVMRRGLRPSREAKGPPAPGVER